MGSEMCIRDSNKGIYIHKRMTSTAVYGKGTSTSPRAQSFQVWVPLGHAGLSHPRFQTPDTRDWRDSVVAAHQIPLGTGRTQSFQPPRYPGTAGAQSYRGPRHPMDRQDSLLSVPQVPSGLAGLSPVRPSGTLGTGRTKSFQCPRYPGNWRD